ncbi:LPXTG cell wall anchor domain-containing protein [Streptomyces sirii]
MAHTPDGCTVAALGGAAVVAGAGAVFVVRRRKAGSGA